MRDLKFNIKNLKFFLLILFFFPALVHAKVVINEVQIAGQTATDEFIELYNNGSEDVNLSGWRLSKKTVSGNEYNLLTAFPSATIPAGSFFIVGHENFTGLKQASYSTSQSLAPDNTVILYQDEGDTIVDIVGFGKATVKEGGVCPNPEEGKSLQRIPNGTDSGQNSIDFASATPTSGRENVADSQTSQPEAPPTAGQTSPPQVPSTQTSTISSTANIVISEILPNPVGTDTEGEWVELENKEGREIDLAGWILEDSSGHAFLISKSLPNTAIAPNGFYTLDYSQTKISLNNSFDTIILKRPDSSVIERVSYLNVDEGQSYARIDGVFKITDSPTKNASNVWTENSKQTTPTPSEGRGSDRSVGADNNKNKNVSSQQVTSNINQGTVNSQQQTINNNRSNLSGTNLQTPTSTTVSLKGKIRLSEIMPNPEGDDEDLEWIEIENISDESVRLEGLKLKDKSSENVLPVKEIVAGGFVVYQKPEFSLTLNNSSESLKLVDAVGEIVDQVSYDDSEEGISFSRFDTAWKWTAPTKGVKNILKEQSTVNSQQNTKKTTKSSSAGGNITVRGTVLVRPNVFGKTILYIAGEEGNYQIYFQKGGWPDLEGGETVEVLGQTSTAGDVPRIKIQSPGQIKIVSEESELEPEERTIEELSDDDIGGLFRISGEMLESSGNSLTIGDETGELEVYFKSSEVKKPAFQQGKPITVTGILVESSKGIRLLPRYPEDVEFSSSRVLGASDELPTKNGSNVWKIVAGVIVAIAVAGFFFRKKIAKHYEKWKESKTPVDDSFEE